MGRSRIFAAVFLAALGCEKPIEPKLESMAQDNPLYRGFFKALFAHHKDMDLGTLVMHSRSSAYGSDHDLADEKRWPYMERELPFLRRDTYDDFWARNKTRYAITLRDAAPWKLRLLSRQAYRRIGAASRNDVDVFWKDFHRTYRDSQLVSISAPGVSADGKQVLLYFTNAFGDLAASGMYYLLENRDGTWVVEDSAMAWIS